MSSLKCSNCGGSLNFLNNEYGYICDSCGCHKDIGGVSNDDADLINLANAKRIDDYKFDDALNLCNQVLDKDPKNQEANWCALLAEYQVIYLQNDEQKYVPSFLNPEANGPMSQSRYYANLNHKYRREADAIEEMRLQVIEEAKTMPDYDVFISYKQHDKDNNETSESDWAHQLYKTLIKSHNGKTLRVFLDKESLSKSNAGWEPHIYSALRSAKVLVLLGSSYENMYSTWVKNEWKRFITYKKPIIVIGQGSKVDPAKLENALRAGQMIEVEDKSWLQKTQKRVWDAVNKNKDVPTLLYEAECLIRQKKFKQAKKSYETVCRIDPKNAQAYWGLLRCRLKAFDDYDIVKSNKKLDRIDEFNNALKYAEGEDKERFERVQRIQLNANVKRHLDKAEFPRTNRNAWLQWSKPRRIAKIIAIVAVVLMIAAFGVYSGFAITQPLSYTVKGNEAVLDGTTIYFNFVVDDLEVNKYKNYYVTAIADGTFNESNLKTVSIGEHVSEIGKNAFKNSKQLTTVKIAGDAVTIGDYAFKGCISLKSVTIGKLYNVENNKERSAVSNSFGDEVFANCTSLESLTVSNCSYVGSNVFAGCKKLTTLVLDLSDNSVVESDAFDKLGNNVTVKLPTVAEAMYAELSAKYQNIKFDTFTRDKVEECVYFISKIKSVSADGEAEIINAENLYNALSDEEKEGVTNYNALKDARIAFNAVSLIAGIGKITLGSESSIVAAESAYEALTDAQKEYISNRAVLQTARAVYNTMVLIYNIGSVTEKSEAKIIEAEKAYLDLTDEQRSLVTNYSELVAAREKVDVIIANSVIDRINTIGEITIENASYVVYMEEVYDRLTDNQKSKVTNYDKLVEARVILDMFEIVSKLGLLRCGVDDNYDYLTITKDNMIEVLNDRSVRDMINSITIGDFVDINGNKLCKAFTNLSSIVYDVSSGTEVSSFVFVTSTLSYKVVGSTTATYDISFTATTGSYLVVEFEYFKLASSEAALDFSAADEASITFTGTCSVSSGIGFAAIKAQKLSIYLSATDLTVTGGNGKENSAGGTGIKATDLTISTGYTAGNSTLVVVGGDGGNGAEGCNGGNGGSAIKAENVSIVMSGSLVLKGGRGGNGGKGVDGQAGAGGYEAWGENRAGNGHEGANGLSGGNGGNGGIAISAKEISLRGGKILLNSGDGGNGGAGGNGGWGGGGGVHHASGLGFCGGGGDGGKGGNGGAGGHGGNALAAVICDILNVMQGDITLVNGSGGNGGNGGNGGRGGNGGQAHGWLWNCGWGGGGGAGGDGGNGGKGGDSQSVSSIIVGVVEKTDGNGGNGGNGGSEGGIGGQGPSNNSAFPNSNYFGKPGEKGENGNVV